MASQHLNVISQRLPFATPASLRSASIACATAAVVMAFAFGRPDAGLAADAELAFLLRGMAVLKATMVLAAIALVLWRFGRPVAPRTAAVYVIGTAALAGATVLVWRLTSIPLAALVFHLAGFAVLLAAWRDEAVSRWRTRPERGVAVGLPDAVPRAQAPDAARADRTLELA
jgi:hypothetical protein